MRLPGFFAEDSLCGRIGAFQAKPGSSSDRGVTMASVFCTSCPREGGWHWCCFRNGWETECARFWCPPHIGL
jgi:hypothetical protein